MGMKCTSGSYQAFCGFYRLCIDHDPAFLYAVIPIFTDASAYEAGKILWPEKTVRRSMSIDLAETISNEPKSTLLITVLASSCSKKMCNADIGVCFPNPFRERNLNKYVMFTMLFSAGMVLNFMNVKQLGLIDKLALHVSCRLCGA